MHAATADGNLGYVGTVNPDQRAALAALLPKGKVVIGIDDTIERRWGSKITLALLGRPHVTFAVTPQASGVPPARCA